MRQLYEAHRQPKRQFQSGYTNNINFNNIREHHESIPVTTFSDVQEELVGEYGDDNKPIFESPVLIEQKLAGIVRNMDYQLALESVLSISNKKWVSNPS